MDIKVTSNDMLKMFHVIKSKVLLICTQWDMHKIILKTCMKEYDGSFEFCRPESLINGLIHYITCKITSCTNDDDVFSSIGDISVKDVVVYLFNLH